MHRVLQRPRGVEMSLDFEPRLGIEALCLLFSHFSRKFSPPGVGFMSFSSALCRHQEFPWQPTHEIRS